MFKGEDSVFVAQFVAQTQSTFSQHWTETAFFFQGRYLAILGENRTLSLDFLCYTKFLTLHFRATTKRIRHRSRADPAQIRRSFVSNSADNQEISWAGVLSKLRILAKA